MKLLFIFNKNGKDGGGETVTTLHTHLFFCLLLLVVNLLLDLTHFGNQRTQTDVNLREPLCALNNKKHQVCLLGDLSTLEHVGTKHRFEALIPFRIITFHPWRYCLGGGRLITCVAAAVPCAAAGWWWWWWWWWWQLLRRRQWGDGGYDHGVTYANVSTRVLLLPLRNFLAANLEVLGSRFDSRFH